MWDQHDGDSAFKELPYYKNVAKSFFKKQIQHLIEEMQKETGEESVIMTVDLQNGTIAHLGSEVGKAFLNDREDLRTEFLSYCISNRSPAGPGSKNKQQGKNSGQNKRKQTESPNRKAGSPKTPKQKKIKSSTSAMTSQHAKSIKSPSGDTAIGSDVVLKSVLKPPQKTASSKIGRDPTFKEKLNIVRDMENNPELSYTQLADRYNVERTTIEELSKYKTS